MIIRHLTIFKIAQASEGIKVINLKEGFLGDSMLKNPPANVGRCRFSLYTGKIPWRR